MGVVYGAIGLAEVGPELDELGVARARALSIYPRIHWEGWGSSLAWFGKVLGATPSPIAEAWAQLFFGSGEMPRERLWPEEDGPEKIPCLGLNIVRYNIGGVGRVEEERASKKSRGWHAEIEGFQPREGERFDWGRDPEQRRFLNLAIEQGADQVELFSNAPMWWMMDSKSSFGGKLSQPDQFVNYLAEVVAQLRSSCQAPVTSVSPFNEPSAGWWNFPHNQEGCNVPVKEQEPILVRLRDELDRRGLQDVLVAASDENTPGAATETWKRLRTGASLGCVGRLNVHGYDGLDPWLEAKHPGVRSRLHCLAEEDRLPIWMSEYGVHSKDGMALAQSILEDVHFLRPSAWCYWQLLEQKCPWGLVEAEFGPGGVRSPQLPHPKYFVFAHFTRFIRPGAELLHCTQPWAMVGYSPSAATLTCVVLNKGTEPCKMRLSIPAFSSEDLEVEAIVTVPQVGQLMRKMPVASVIKSDEEDALELRVDMPAEAVCTVVISKASRSTSAEAPSGVTAEQVVTIAKAAAHAAVTERKKGQTHASTRKSWAEVDHLCACSFAALESAPSAASNPSEEMDELRQLIFSSAWGATNQRAYGEKSSDARRSWERFHSKRQEEQHRLSDDLIWAIFNTTWAVVNAAWYGEENNECKSAAERALGHLSRVGGTALVLPTSSPTGHRGLLTHEEPPE